MREKKNYRIITFHTTSAAMAMEKYCGENPAEYEQKKEQIHTFGIETDQSVELVI